MLKKILYIPKSIRGLLVLAIVLATIRILFWDTFTFSFIYWNILLALIPFFISSLILYLSEKFKIHKSLIILEIIIWLVFLPNAFYIVTDLVHIGKIRAVPVFFDVVLIFCSAVLGVLLGINSVFNIENVLKRLLSNKKVKFILFLIFLFLSFGVYLGRFLRFNSWDIVINTKLFIKTIQDILFNPIDNSPAFLYTTLFFLLFYTLYFTFKNFKLE